MKIRTVPIPMFLLFLLLGASTVGATKPQAKTAEPPPVTSESPPETFREQTIYIPFEKLPKVFETEGRGVFVPYERFNALWQAARENKAPSTPQTPAVTSLLSEFHGRAKVSGDVLEVSATVTLELFKKGWTQVPIRLPGAAIRSATIAGKPARLLRDHDGHHLLLYQDSASAPPIQLELNFAKAVSKSPGRNHVSFDAPLAPVSRWEIDVPEGGVKVNVQPALAATEDRSNPKQEKLIAFVGATPRININWKPKSEGARGLKAVAAVTARQTVRIADGVLRTRARLDYAISRAELTELKIYVTGADRVINVFDPNVREWTVAAAPNGQHITVQLFEPAKSKQRLLVELERFHKNEPFVMVPVAAVDVGRQQGTVLVTTAAGLRADVRERSGLMQIDASELADHHQKNVDVAYRYAALPCQLDIEVRPIESRISVQSLLQAQLFPDRITMDWLAVFNIEHAGVFSLPVALPPDFTIRQVKGVAIGDAAAAVVDTHHPGEQPGQFNISLSRKALGKVAIAIQLQRRIAEPLLATPTGKMVELPLPLPRAIARANTQRRGHMVVYSPSSLHVAVGHNQHDGLRAIPHTAVPLQLQQALPTIAGQATLAFAYDNADTELVLNVKRRKPYVSVRQMLEARLESGVIKYHATLFYNIQYGGVQSLRLDVPTAIADNVHLLTGGIRKSKISTATPAPAEGHVAWRLTGETEFTGQRTLKLSWESRLGRLEVGNNLAIPLPNVRPQEVNRSWGQIAIAKAESIDIRPAGEFSGLRPIDPRQELMPGTSMSNAALAYEFHEEQWQLNLNATRYQAKDVKVTSVERGLVRMVVTRGDVISVQAAYRMRSARQRLAIRLPDGVSFDTQPLRLNGRPVPLEQGESGTYYVPLAKQAADTPFLLELRYTQKQSQLTLEQPSFPNEPAIQHVYLSVFVPEVEKYLGHHGEWHSELTWAVRGFTARPRGRQSDDWLNDWVGGTLAGHDHLKTFAADGRHLLYSTLRPRPGGDGALSIRLGRAWVMDVIAIVLVLTFGIVLLKRPLSHKLLALGSVLTAGVFLVVFARSFTYGMVNNGTAAASFLVLVGWSLYSFLTRPTTVSAAPVDTPPSPIPPPAQTAEPEDDIAKNEETASVPAPPPLPTSTTTTPDVPSEDPEATP